MAAIAEARARAFAEGRAARDAVPRSVHAVWSAPADRPDPIAILQASDADRIAELVPLRYERMSKSPFAFLRGSASVMACDLAHSPTTGIQVQACGDAHLANFGVYTTPERNHVFDLNDFDETLPAPWEWDVKRLATSIVLAGRENGIPDAGCDAAVAACLHEYRERVHEMARWGHLDVWYANVDADDVVAIARRRVGGKAAERMAKATRAVSLRALPGVIEAGGTIRIKDDPGKIEHVSVVDGDNARDVIDAFVREYRESLPDDRRVLLDRYRVVDVARKVAGVGSVGTWCFIALLIGAGRSDRLFLQVKEARRSALEEFAQPSMYDHPGRRVVIGQRLVHAAPDIFLGWGSAGGRQFYVRQLRDRKGSVELAKLGRKQLAHYSAMCGWVLARAHARGGGAAAIAGYLGSSAAFDRAIVTFAGAYAEQMTRDHTALLNAIDSGRVPT